MAEHQYVTIDGNEATSYIAYRVNEVCAIYPITPSSSMAELADEWSSKGIKNIWGDIPTVYEMQSEGGAAGTVHGALQTGSLTTTFTASQGLLLKIPNMFKIAGELTSTVFHVSARALATHALSIFGEHSDVMAARSTGFAFLSSASVQEAMDFALIAQASTLRSRVPFLHFFDGFRTSHEVAKIELVPEKVIREMIDDDLVQAHKSRALSPDDPKIRGTAQNPDVFFQNREACNKFYRACPDIVQKEMDKFAKLTGRQYKLYEYHGHPQAEEVIIAMASGVETIEETVNYLNKNGHKVGLVKVRLFRPFDTKGLINAIPPTCRKIAVLDRTKEPGGAGEPLYLDVSQSFMEQLNRSNGTPIQIPKIVGGRYGLSSKEFTPAMVMSVFENLKLDHPKNHFTVGINDDVTFTSLDYDKDFDLQYKGRVSALFFGLGADGTVGANKNSIKIIGENTPNYAQGYFVYDSKKSGSTTISHLRFGPEPIHAPYLIRYADFVACHQPQFLDQIDMLRNLKQGGKFLINVPWSKEDAWKNLPKEVQKDIIDKEADVHIIDAQKVAAESGMGRRINTVMQVCFFGISGVLPKTKAIKAIKESIIKTYGKKGQDIVNMNLKAVDNTLEHLYQLEVPKKATGKKTMHNGAVEGAPDFVEEVLRKIIKGDGDELPVSAFPVDGTYPTATSQYEKRNIALKIPEWDESICIQCGKCAMVCPHAVIRIKAFPEKLMKDAPSAFKTMEVRDKDWKEDKLKYSIQVSPEDCTGCSVCVEVCPVKNKSNVSLKALNMVDQVPILEQEKENWDFFLTLPELDRSRINVNSIGQQQIQQPLFEFSGACSGCGETPYVKLVSQLFGDRTIIANATGCSSIYGGNLPTTPYSTTKEGLGPSWSNSLFEDNAEFGLGFRLSIDKQKEIAENLLRKLGGKLDKKLVAAILEAEQVEEQDIFAQRDRVRKLKTALRKLKTDDSKRLLGIADYLVKKSVWIVGGDGWAYDIGYGGLDHVIASGKNVNILVMDTEVYSNTGGQASKATPTSAIAKFAAGGKPGQKKDLGMMAMSYGHAYVATVAMGAKDLHTLKTFVEAEAYDGPSIIIAYSHCIAHGINMEAPLQNQKAAVDSGQWILYRYNPDLVEEGKNPLSIDSKPKKLKVADYMNMENRFRMLLKSNPEVARIFYKQAQETADNRLKHYQYLAAEPFAEPTSNETEKNNNMDLQTSYCGLKLKSPLVVSASPLSEELSNIKFMEDSGASAVVLYSLFEEQLTMDARALHYHTTEWSESHAEATSYFPEADEYKLGPEEYLEHIMKAKSLVEMPIIASLNAAHHGSWEDFAVKIEEAGADALELNIYYIPNDFDLSGEQVEQNYVDILKAVKKKINIPVTMKLSPYFSNLVHMVKKLDVAGVDGLVLFNRFYQPDIDLQMLEVKSDIVLSKSYDIRMPMRWIALLKGRLKASLAATTGIHTGYDVIKLMMVGADVCMLNSILLKKGISEILTVEKQMTEWMEANEYESIRQMQGSMSQLNTPNPEAFERAQYMKAITNFPT